MKDWVKVKLGTLLTESKIETTNPDANKRISVKLNVKGVEKRPLTKDKEGATKYYTRKVGQFIYGKQNLHKGAFGLVPEELDGYESSSDIPAFDVDDSCYPEWIYYFFKKGNFYLKLESLAKGVGSKRIHPHQIFDLDIFLPKKEEQKEILDRIAELESNHGALLFEIESQESLLTQLRQSILQDAIQGKLTEKWREQNPEVESASELLKRIQAEKEQLLKEKKIKKENPLPKIKEDEIPFEIPECWKWCRLQDICEIITKGSSPKWQGINYVSNEEVLFVTSENVGTKKLLLEKKKYVEHQFNEIQPRSILRKNDILMNIVGASIGRTALFNLDLTANINQAVTIIRLIQGFDYDYFINFFNSPTCLNYMYDKQVDNARPNLSMGNIAKFVIPIPPLNEQYQISKQIMLVENILDDLQNQILTGKVNAETLVQAVLSELLGEENILTSLTSMEKKTLIPEREIKYNSKTTLMELVELLKKHGRLHAEDLWKMSKYPEDIDKFYAELKKQIEQKNTIKESAEKGYLELA